MATDLEKLVVQLSADIKGYEREMRKATGVTNTQARAIERRYTQMGQNLDRIGSSAARSLIAPLAAVIAGAGVREVARYADAWTSAGNKVKAAAEIAGTAARPLEAINEIATSTRGGFEETATLYSRLLRSTAGVAKSEEEVARATEIVNKAFKAGGASSSEMAAGILQLSQGLSSGILAGDELRSVRENAPLLAQAIADYFKTTVGGLKQLGAEGKLTSGEIFKAILSGGDKVESAFKVTNATISDGITKVNNALTQYIGQSDASLSGSARLSAGLGLLADNFDNIADATLKVAAVIAGALVGRSIVGMIGKLGVATTAVGAFVSALRAATSIGAATAAIGGLSAVAGPLGLLIGGTVVGALALFGTQTKEATAAAKSYAEALKLVENNATTSGEAAAGAGRKYVEAQKNALKGGVGVGEGDIARIKAQIETVFSDLSGQYDRLAARNVVSPAQLAELEEIIKGFRSGAVAAEDTKDALYRLANSNPRLQSLADKLAPLLDQLNKATKATSILQAELGKLGGGAPSFRQAEEESTKRLAQYDAMRKAAADYIADAQKRNALSKEELAIQTEIAKIQKDAQSKGVSLDPAQARKLAEQNVAADARRSSEGKAVRKTGDDRIDADLQQIRDRTAALIAETQNINLSTEAQERNRVALDLQQSAVAALREEARRKGETDLASIELSPEQIASIDAVAAAYGRASAALERANGPLASYAREAANVDQQLQQTAVSGLQQFEDAFAGIITGSTTAAEAFKNMANSIISDLVRIAIRKAITGPIASLLGLADGGFVGGGGGGFSLGTPGGTGGGLGGLYDSGGFTGPGGKYQPAGIVHKGEYVFDQDSVRRIGVGQLERLRKGFSNGGYVGVPSLSASSRGVSDAARVNVQVINNAPAKVRVQEQPRSNGGMNLRLLLDSFKQEVASDIARGGSGINRSIEGRYGTNPVAGNMR